MKCLGVLRHAKSSWAERGVNDHDRPLNDRGWDAARRMGREMKHRGMRFDHVLASTARRVRETLNGVREEFAIDSEIRFDSGVYLATGDRLLEFVRDFPDCIEGALLVGHNPGLQQLVLALTRAGPLRNHVADKYPTGAVAIMDLPVERWTDVQVGSGEIAELILPRDLD